MAVALGLLTPKMTLVIVTFKNKMEYDMIFQEDNEIAYVEWIDAKIGTLEFLEKTEDYIIIK